MDASRRCFLTSAGALAVAGVACRADEPGQPTDAGPSPTPAPPREAEPARWEPEATLDAVAFPWPLASGDVTRDGALVAARVTEPVVDLVVMQADGEGWTEVQRHTGLAPAEGWLAVTLTGLQPDTAYNLVLQTPDGRRGEVSRLRTAVAAGAHRTLTFGATSCLGGDQPTWDSLAHAAAEDLDLVLLLGDTVYADGSVTVDDYRAEYEQALATPTFHALLRSTSVVATWDDHEVANNWVLGTTGDPLKDPVTLDQFDAALQAFREAIPQRTGPGGTGIWRSVTWGDLLEVVVLDSRGERADGRIVSDAQLDWAVDTLQASTAVFKLVLCSVHLTDHLELLAAIQQEDRWQGYPEQRTRLAQACADVPGVLVLTGDMHYGALQRLDPAGGPASEVWEVAAGPAGSRLFLIEGITALMDEVPEQYAFLLEDHSVCLFEADPGTGTITVRFVDGSGAVVHEQALQVARGPSTG